MIEFEITNQANEEVAKIIYNGFDKYAKQNEIHCNYKKFNFIAKDKNKIVGILAGHSYYDEVHIENLIVLKEYRHQNIGSMLLKKVEEHYKNENIDNFNLTTYEFQAPKFYEKMGYTLEFVRKNSRNPKLNKYYYSKKIVPEN